MPRKTAAAPAEAVALYEKLVATHPLAERKGAMMPYTSVNGNMTSLLTKDGTLALRLPEKEREAFLKKYKTKITEQYGAVMREYVDVPAALLKKTAELKKYFAISYAYTRALRAKPTTRTKKAAK